MQRRSFIKSVVAVAAASTVLPTVASAAKPKGKNDLSFKAAVKAITGGKGLKKSSKVKLKAPEIAENGAVVPIKVTVNSAIGSVKAIHVLASKNGNSRVASIALTPANGKPVFGTRIKLNGTQEVVVIAEMSNGTFLSTSQSVKVTIGGCG